MFIETTEPLEIGIAFYPPGASLGPRIRTDYELVWMIEGDALYEADSKIVPVPRDSILLCQPGSRDIFRWDKNQRTQHAYVHFDVLSMEPGFVSQELWPTVRSLPTNDLLRPLFQHLITWNTRVDTSQSQLTLSYMLQLFICGNSAIGSPLRSGWPHAVEQVCSHIYRSIERDPAFCSNLSELANVADVSAQHLCRLFRTHVGHSPLEVQRLARLDYAAGLVARTNYKISEISEICGFYSPYHFSRAFSLAFNLPPSKLRESLANGEISPLPRLMQWAPSFDDNQHTPD